MSFRSSDSPANPSVRLDRAVSREDARHMLLSALKKLYQKARSRVSSPLPRESTVHTCVLQPCLESRPLSWSHRACCLRSSNPQLRHRRHRRVRRPRNNQQIRAHRLPPMSRRTQLRYSRLRHSRRQVSPGSNRQQLPKLARVRKRRHGRSSTPLALETERSLAPRRSAFWG